MEVERRIVIKVKMKEDLQVQEIVAKLPAHLVNKASTLQII
jgi:hypothetical protein